MNTLPKAVTSTFFVNPDGFEVLSKRWKTICNDSVPRKLDAFSHYLYAILRGKDWKKGFTPPSNSTKIENGAFQGWDVRLFGYRMKNNPNWTDHYLFFDLLVPDIRTKLSQVVELYWENPGSYKELVVG